ncbi:D-serine deaminase-like pyridoxal phosphate-dependent protein [Sinobacterium caligoides]|uniref:D-serine deaminase-like pyridoxal phosphate-dependent protein n=1 Tax=Sinobacterium caligoides TaxID=933926 RepID=A0A3N2DGI5_9GAMM|nr:DSD1 family PLP-dependent enzyme [Sinobacterium caligoides]ROR98910.1 D-serine deaminase-like pyridoxal phosphate-dependent protein [Sinobacterium caligoides]
MTLDELDTPALVVDLDVMEANLQAMQQRVSARGLKLRPHTKAHKIPALAQRQLSLGGEGICTAKLGEAEVMADAGIMDILITTPIAHPIKYQRLVALYLAHPEGVFCQVVDHAEHVLGIGKCAVAAGVNVELLIEVESGQQRCGVALGKSLVDLIKLIEATEGVSYRGIQAYSGHLQHVQDFAQRQAQARAAVLPIFDFIDNQLLPQGLAPRVVSGGGTGTYQAYTGLGFTEIQAGSYIFMDAAYRALASRDNSRQNDEFSNALKVWTTVISHPTPERAVLDAGMKCLSIDMGMPLVEGREDIRYQSGGDEHGILHLAEGEVSLTIGQRLLMLPSHCDTTLNSYQTLYGIRGDEVVQSWDIAGRGRSD